MAVVAFVLRSRPIEREVAGYAGKHLSYFDARSDEPLKGMLKVSDVRVFP